MSASANHFEIRPDWLASQPEGAIDPTQIVVDAHHHLYDRPGLRYLLEDYLADIGGHDIRASVFVQARAMLRADGPVELQPLGETEFVNGVAAMSASGIYGSRRVCAGIVGFADLGLGDAVRPILERQIMAGGGLAGAGGRFCGIRQTLCWDEDAGLLNPAYPTTSAMMESSAFREGFAHLPALGLSFDAWALFPQLSRLAALARAFPETRIVLNHCGGIVRIRGYEGRDEVYDHWRAGISDLAQCANVSVKLSGLGMRMVGFGLDGLPQAPSSALLAERWRPWIEHCIESFGADRCMWGSNFPVDKGSSSLTVGLNAMQRLTGSATAEERNDIFWRSAKEFYRLPEGLFGVDA